MTILSNGNVGIGTTAPNAKLDVNYDSAGYSSTGYNIPALYLTASDTNNDHTGIGFRGVSGYREAFFGVVQGSATNKGDFVFVNHQWHGICRTHYRGGPGQG